MRCVKESKMHEQNMFLTLTYDEDHVPEDYSLNVEDMQNFFKRLRYQIDPIKFRYFQCGEYGDQTHRPHHHALIFGYKFHDLEYSGRSQSGSDQFTSQVLDALWQKGKCWIGEVNFESCAYVARYVTKKIYGEKSEDHYAGRKPEYVTMSRNPGIGMPYLKKYGKEIYETDTIICRGKPMSPPKAFDNKYGDQDKIEEIKKARMAKARKRGNETPKRLLEIEQAKIQNQKRIKRK